MPVPAARTVLAAALATLLGASLLARPAGAQRPWRDAAEAVEARYDPAHPVLHYTLRVDTTELATFAVAMRVRYPETAAPARFRVAWAAHPEYDDRYWRHVEAMRVDADSGPAPDGLRVTREDSAVWRVNAPGGACTRRACVVRWRVWLPTPGEQPRAAWRPFLTATGALVGGPHAFPFVVGAELAPAHVTLDMPAAWDVATGLVPTADPRTFFAPTADALVEGPVLAGRLRSWRFAVDGVPHRVAYWPAPGAVPFDTAAFVGGLRGLAEQAAALFGRPPWREYTFLMQDAAYGGLEHANAVSLGAPSADLARDPHAALGEAAHEFVHAWNLVRVRPAEYGGVTWRARPAARTLWFGEGLTMFYADLLLRRAGLPADTATRAGHLAGLVRRFVARAGNARWSLERVSRAEYNAPVGALGDAPASAHVQGELFGAVLDLRVRDATGGRRSMDDVMRLVNARFGGAARGIGSGDVERAASEVCGCDLAPLFARHVRGRADGTQAAPLDVAGALAPFGMRLTVAWDTARGPDGGASPDVRMFAEDRPAGAPPVLVVLDPAGAWARAGLHTGDALLTLDGAPVRGWRDVRTRVRGARAGDTLRVEVARAGTRLARTVRLTGFLEPRVRVDDVADAPPRARALRAAWAAGGEVRRRP